MLFIIINNNNNSFSSLIMFAYPVTRNMTLRLAAKISLTKINIRATIANVNRNLKNTTTNYVAVNNNTIYIFLFEGVGLEDLKLWGKE